MTQRLPRFLALCATAAATLAVAASYSPAKSGTAPSGLAYSTASNHAVQPQPAAGSCHAIGRGPFSRPDHRCTPGRLNPAVTQATIGRTICRSGWTATVRPAESITEREKYMSMAAYGDGGSASAFEYDHFIPLELGGATNDARNLWPEPGGTPNPKDRVENYLKREVCDRRLTLARAQTLIATNWIAVYRELTDTGSSAPAQTAPAAAHCSASAAWNSTYGDYDVYVTSNEPDSTATVTGAGSTASYRTNSSGYADVYFHADRAAAGDAITVKVGSATCHATL
jgi:hypothetical protein